MKNLLLVISLLSLFQTSVFSQNASNEDYVFMEVTEEERLRDIIKQFDSYVVYMDIWATWCSSCIGEFKFKKALDSNLKNKDVKLLYIAIDRPDRLDKWKELIYKHELKGYHIFASTNLENQLREVFGYDSGTLDFPHFTIFKKDSDIGEKNALWPNSKQALYDQIDQFLK